MIVRKVATLRKASGFVRTTAWCRVALKALFSCSNATALVAEMSAHIAYVVQVREDALRGLVEP